MSRMGRARQPTATLTDRQREVLRLLAKGHTNGEIAERLGISLAGAKWHVSELLTRFGVESRDELADRAAAESGPGATARRWSGALAGLVLSTAHTGALLAITGTIVTVAGALAVIDGARDGDLPPVPLPADATAPDPARPGGEQLALLPSGGAIPFGWYNGVEGGLPIVAYPAPGRGWCVVGRNADGSAATQEMCETDFDPRDPPIRSNMSTSFKDGVMGEVTVRLVTSPDVVRIVVLPGDGRELEFETYAPPPALGINRRFAWVNIGLIVPAGYVVTGLGTAGQETGHEAHAAPGPPPPNPPAAP